MNALERIFKTYDIIRTEGHADEHDAPPWNPPADTTTPPVAVAPPPPVAAPSDGAVHLNRPKDTMSWGDVRAEKEERAQKLMEERLKESGAHIDRQNTTITDRLHEGHANKLLNDREDMPNGGVTFKQDEKGMDAGYGYKSFPGASYDDNTGTLYIAGSDSWRSWYDDFRNVPVWGDLTDAERYKQAERAYDDLTQKLGKSVHRVVGHSLGGSVALELAKNKGIEFSRTFGAPVVDPNPFHRGSVERYRHPLDPVSIADRGASWGTFAAYPHSYGGFQHLDRVVPQPVRGLALDHKTLALRQRSSGY